MRLQKNQEFAQGLSTCFGVVGNSMNGSFIRTIGISGLSQKIGMMNLTTKFFRCTKLKIVVVMG